jgi:hypothetical protein
VLVFSHIDGLGSSEYYVYYSSFIAFAAITDGNFTIFMRFGRDLVVTLQLIDSVGGPLESCENDGQAIEDEIS